MNFYEKQRLFSMLLAMIMVLFVAGNLPYVSRWRRQLRGVAILSFIFATLIALAEIAAWLATGQR